MNDNRQPWLTREEAASYLRISVRQLDRLPIPRSLAAGSRSPRYERGELDRFMQTTVQAPAEPAAAVPPGRVVAMRRPARLVSAAVAAADRGAWLRAMRQAHVA